jgi:hypothetical protein
MKAKLIFDLSEPDELTDFKRMNKSSEMAAAIFEFKYNAASRIRNSINSELLCKDDLIEHIFDIFNDILENHDINIEELIS